MLPRWCELAARAYYLPPQPTKQCNAKETKPNW